MKLSIFLIYIALVYIMMFIIGVYDLFYNDGSGNKLISASGNFSKMKYVLSVPDKFDSFIFGSSRVGYIHNDKISGEKCYNMTSSAANATEHLWNLKTMLKNNIRPKKIYIGVDSFTHTELIEWNSEVPGHCPYEYLVDEHGFIRPHMFDLYFNPAMLPGDLKRVWINYSNYRITVITIFKAHIIMFLISIGTARKQKSHRSEYAK